MNFATVLRSACTDFYFFALDCLEIRPRVLLMSKIVKRSRRKECSYLEKFIAAELDMPFGQRIRDSCIKAALTSKYAFMLRIYPSSPLLLHQII